MGDEGDHLIPPSVEPLPPEPQPKFWVGDDYKLPELSEWTLVICGHSGLRITPLKGEEPGPIRRWLCRLLLGFEWRRNC